MAREPSLHAHHHLGRRRAVGHHGEPYDQLGHTQRERERRGAAHQPLGAEVEGDAAHGEQEGVHRGTLQRRVSRRKRAATK